MTQLVELLQSSRPRDRWKAADKLGRRGRGSDEVVAALLLCAQDEDDDVRCSAARALGHAGTDRCAPELVRLLGDDDGGVRWGAAEGLGNLGASASCGLVQLREALDDIEEDVRGASAQTLGKLVRLVAVPANDLVAPLIRSLSDRAWSVRRSAVEALGRCGAAASSGSSEIQQLAESDPHPRVRQAAEVSLRLILGPAQA